jgi:hypothetical protein
MRAIAPAAEAVGPRAVPAGATTNENLAFVGLLTAITLAQRLCPAPIPLQNGLLSVFSSGAWNEQRNPSRYDALAATKGHAWSKSANIGGIRNQVFADCTVPGSMRVRRSSDIASG